MQQKVVFILVDGLGDVSVPSLHHQTPLAFAETPWMDRCAEAGVCGLIDPVEPGLACGSDTAHLSLFGYDPRHWYRGRGAFETMGTGLSMQPGDIAFKSNFATWCADTNTVLRRRADRQFEGEGPVLCAALDGTRVPKFPDYEIAVQYATEHRCAVRIRGPMLSDNITGTDPLKDGLELRKCMPVKDVPEHLRQGDAELTSALVNAISKQFHIILSSHPINSERRKCGKPEANIVLLRGCGMRLDVPTWTQRFPSFHRAFAIAPTCIISGFAQTLDMDVMKVNGTTGAYSTNLSAKAQAALLHLAQPEYRFGFIHVKAVDDAGHDRDIGLKVEWINRVDTMLGEIVECLKTWEDAQHDVETFIVVTGDHSTPVEFGDHSHEPVPFLICPVGNVFVQVKHPKDRVKRFSELDCGGGALGRFPGAQVMPTIIRYMNT